MSLLQYETHAPALPAASSRVPRRRVVGAGLVALATLAVTLSPVTPAAAAPHTDATSIPVAQGDPLALKAAMAVDTYGWYMSSSNRRSIESFHQQVMAVAAEVAVRLELDPGVLQQAWAAADRPHQVALMAGLSQLGVRYRKNSSLPGEGFDCSGLTLFAWGQAGVALPRSSRAQIKFAAPRTRDTAQAGDLAYYPGHVMMWLGVDNAILHSPTWGRDVQVSFVAKRKANWVRFGDPTGDPAS